MLQDKVWVWNLESGIWSIESGIWGGGVRLDLSAVSEGSTEGDLIGKGEVDAEWKPTG